MRRTSHYLPVNTLWDPTGEQLSIKYDVIVFWKKVEFMLSFGLFLLLTLALIFSRYIKLFGAINVFFIFLIGCFFSFNRQNNDYEGYVEIFKMPETYAEPGYVALVNFIKFFGGDHNVLISILGVLVSFTLFRLTKYTNFIAFGLLCYMIFPMPIDITQIRNTIALVCFINSLIDLSKSRLFLSFVFILLSMLFHFFGVVYFLIWIGLQFRALANFRYFVIFLVSISFIISPFIIPIIGSISSLRTISYYMSTSLKIHSFIIWGVSLAVDLVVISYCLNVAKINMSEKHVKFVVVIYSALLLMFVFSSGLLFVDEFNRLFRTGYVLKYIIVSTIIPFINFRYGFFLILYVFFSALVMGTYFTLMLNYDYILFGL